MGAGRGVPEVCAVGEADSAPACWASAAALAFMELRSLWMELATPLLLPGDGPPAAGADDGTTVPGKLALAAGEATAPADASCWPTAGWTCCTATGGAGVNCG